MFFSLLKGSCEMENTIVELATKSKKEKRVLTEYFHPIY